MQVPRKVKFRKPLEGQIVRYVELSPTLANMFQLTYQTRETAVHQGIQTSKRQGSTLTLTRFPLESKFTSWKVKKRK